MRHVNPMAVYHFACETTFMEPRQIHELIEQSSPEEDGIEETPAEFSALLHLRAHFAVVTHFTAVEVMP